jgi:hypothetical protein
VRAKKLPRLWCALQGLLPLEQCLAAQEGELAWPRESVGARTPPGRKGASERAAGGAGGLGGWAEGGPLSGRRGREPAGWRHVRA